MKKIISALCLFTLLVMIPRPGAASTSEAPTLEDQIKSLDLSNQAPQGVSKEKMYSVQDRYLSLVHKNEFTMGLAQNLTSDSFIQTQQFELGYRFHISNRWSAGLAYSFVQNKFTEAGTRLIVADGVVPDVAYASHRGDLTVEYNIFYGKFRLSMDQVLYFDMYGALGGGIMELNSGNQNAAVADAGFAFWLGKWGSVRLGLKDYYYNEPHHFSAVAAHNLHGHLDVGYLF